MIIFTQLCELILLKLYLMSYCLECVRQQWNEDTLNRETVCCKVGNYLQPSKILVKSMNLLVETKHEEVQELNNKDRIDRKT